GGPGGAGRGADGPGPVLPLDPLPGVHGPAVAADDPVGDPFLPAGARAGTRPGPGPVRPEGPVRVAVAVEGTPPAACATAARGADPGRCGGRDRGSGALERQRFAGLVAGPRRACNGR